MAEKLKMLMDILKKTVRILILWEVLKTKI